MHGWPHLQRSMLAIVDLEERFPKTIRCGSRPRTRSPAENAGCGGAFGSTSFQ